MRRVRLATILLLPCLSLVSGCTEIATFNNTMMEMTQELEKAGRTFGEQVMRHEGNRGKLEEDYADAVGAVGKIVKRAKAIRVPDVEGARAYYDAFLAYMDFEDGAVEDGFRKLISAAARRDRESLLTNMERMNALEKKEIAKMKAAQKEFAQANNLTVRE